MSEKVIAAERHLRRFSRYQRSAYARIIQSYGHEIAPSLNRLIDMTERIERSNAYLDRLINTELKK